MVIDLARYIAIPVACTLIGLSVGFRCGTSRTEAITEAHYYREVLDVMSSMSKIHNENAVGYNRNMERIAAILTEMGRRSGVECFCVTNGIVYSIGGAK